MSGEKGRKARLNFVVKKQFITGKAAVLFLGIAVLLSGCKTKEEEPDRKSEMSQWLESAELSDTLTREELYSAALMEDTLVVYSVSSRAFEVKESFEKEYPGLTVDIKDIRGNDVVDMVRSDYESGENKCDIIICSDCDGSLYMNLIEPGLVYSYVPWDIAAHMKEGHSEGELNFLGEVLMLFYNGEAFGEQPIENIWELTEEQYNGKIIMASPLSSFSTYGFCATILGEEDAMQEAYEEYYDIPFTAADGKNAGELFWERVSPYIVYTNSSDEVMEGVGNSGSDGMLIGIMISSKMRYRELGYHMTPIYRLEPFAAVYTPNSVMIAGGSKNINSAKLFVRYLLGESEGTGEGLKPFSTEGTWSTRTDVADGNQIPLCEMNYVAMDKKFLYENKKSLDAFFERLLKENIGQ